MSAHAAVFPIDTRLLELLARLHQQVTRWHRHSYALALEASSQPLQKRKKDKLELTVFLPQMCRPGYRDRPWIVR